MGTGRFVVGVVLVLLAGGAWLLAVYFLRKGLPSLLWPRVPGRILVSTVDGGDGLAAARLSYEYVVGDQRHTGKRVSPFDGQVAFGGQGDRIAADFPEGAEVPVWHHPKWGAQSVLRRGPGMLGWSVIGGALLLTAIALLTLFDPTAPAGKLIASVTAFAAILAGVMTVSLATAGNGVSRFVKTQGVVISSQVLASEGSMAREAGKPQPMHYSAVVRYRFEVGGQSFESDRLQLGMGGVATTIPSIAQSTVDHYPVGREVTVFHDPRNPQRSVLMTTSSSVGVVFAGLAAAGFGFATVVLYSVF